MKLIKNISFYIVLGIIIVFVARLLDSDFLFVYLKDNIVGLLLTLLAINTATSGLIASKIQDILVEYKGIDFSSSIKEMKFSLLEQIVLISVSIIVLLVLDGRSVVFEYKIDIGNIILTSILIYSIAILWDTGKAVFIVIEELQKLNKKK